MASQYPHSEHQLASLPREVLLASEQYYGGGGAPPRAWPEQQHQYAAGAHADDPQNGAQYGSYAQQPYFQQPSPTRRATATVPSPNRHDFGPAPPQNAYHHPASLSQHHYQTSISYEPRMWPPAPPTPDDPSWRNSSSLFGAPPPVFSQHYGATFRGEGVESVSALAYLDGGRSGSGHAYAPARTPEQYEYLPPYGGQRTASLPGPTTPTLTESVSYPRRSSHPTLSPPDPSPFSQRPAHQPFQLHFPPPPTNVAPGSQYPPFPPHLVLQSHPATPPANLPGPPSLQSKGSLHATSHSSYSFDFMSPDSHPMSSHSSTTSVLSLPSPPQSFSFVKPEDLEAPSNHSRSHSHAGSLSPSDVSPDHAINLAASLRVHYHRSALPLAFNPARTPNSATLTAASTDGKSATTYSRPGRGKPILELETACWTCGDAGPKLVVRGEKLDWPAKATFTCIACVVVEDGDDVAAAPPVEASNEPTYKDTLSFAVDAFQGLEEEEEEGPPLVDPSPALPADIKNQALNCDVCTRLTGTGKVTALSSGKAPSFTTEVVCLRCQELYKPCSDCGGGGGRLTSGRWRCRELFPDGRRTCRLSHHRMPPLAEISYEVHRIDDIADSTAEDLEKKCREVYFNSRFGVIARPDSLERGDGLARTFKQVERSTIDQWHLLAPMLQERDVEATCGRRRYLAIQSAPQQGRRPRGKIEVVPTIDSGDSPPPSDRSMTGFMLVEHDLVHGTLLFAAALPWVLSGPSFDASTELGGLAVQRAKADLYHTNHEREALGLAAFPPIKYLWLLSPFQSDSKWAKSLALRNYRLASEVAQEEPDFPFQAFPPHREVFIPAQFLRGFQLFVRKLESNDDVGGQPEAPRKKRPKRRGEA